jgi:hypothetical protein
MVHINHIVCPVCFGILYNKVSALLALGHVVGYLNMKSDRIPGTGAAIKFSKRSPHLLGQL